MINKKVLITLGLVFAIIAAVALVRVFEDLPGAEAGGPGKDARRGTGNKDRGMGNGRQTRDCCANVFKKRKKNSFVLAYFLPPIIPQQLTAF